MIKKTATRINEKLVIWKMVNIEDLTHMYI